MTRLRFLAKAAFTAAFGLGLVAVPAAGIAQDRLTAAGFGPDRPIADNSQDDGRARNRRVELVKS